MLRDWLPCMLSTERYTIQSEVADLQNRSRATFCFSHQKKIHHRGDDAAQQG